MQCHRRRRLVHLTRLDADEAVLDVVDAPDAARSRGCVELGDELIGGGMAAGADTPANAPSTWLVYFAVADTDATVAKLTQLGGGVHHAPEDIPGVGRFAVVHDPQGAVFGLLQNTQMPAS